MQTSPRIDPAKLQAMDETDLRALVGTLLQRIDEGGRQIRWRDAKISKLSFEIAQIRRL